MVPCGHFSERLSANQPAKMSNIHICHERIYEFCVFVHSKIICTKCFCSYETINNLYILTVRNVGNEWKHNLIGNRFFVWAKINKFMIGFFSLFCGLPSACFFAELGIGLELPFTMQPLNAFAVGSLFIFISKFYGK